MTHHWTTFHSYIDKSAPLWYWMTERHSIWEKRNIRHEPKPWTEDTIFQTFRFCNVFRELDVVTIWIDKNIRKPFANHEHLWFMLAIARTINHPETLAELMNTIGSWPSHKHFSPLLMGETLQRRKEAGKKVYTGAYMIRAESNKLAEWYSWTKQKYIAEIVLGRLWDDRAKITRLLESTKKLQYAWEILAWENYYIGWGPFMTYEWVTDLRHTRYFDECSDAHSWANAGPGALRGLQRLGDPDGKLLGKKVRPLDTLWRMQELMIEGRRILPTPFAALEMRDIEHSLCEMDKYLRVYHNEGRPRAKYPGHH